MLTYTATTSYLTVKSSLLQLQENGRPLAFTDVIKHWQDSAPFREFYTDTLLKHGGNGCFWEHPRLNKLTANQAYECVITQTDAFSLRTANFRPFSRAVSPGDRIATFPNLSGEALLVVPNPSDEINFNGRDLISFLRTAPDDFIHDLWENIGQETAKAIATDAPFQYLSTHGLGVLWLHVRLEQGPKYYHHRAYR
ncbi:DUF6940 family protein [Neolewinella persica]|uniref:DUF6940 family protein n=1 Tax=Neolewinella persica TaxID=70998 RepID=UPI00035D1493|nr:hypothetical protein [Neolewinella persica]